MVDGARAAAATSEPAAKRARTSADEKSAADLESSAALCSPSETPAETQSSSSSPPPPPDASLPAALKLVTWNVASFRSAAKALAAYAARAKPDIICLQETKLRAHEVPGPFFLPAYPHKTWFCSSARKGYSGTAVLSKLKPRRVSRGIPGAPAHSGEGRCIVAEFDAFVLVNVYVPNSGMKSCERLGYRVNEWDVDLRRYLASLAERGAKAVVWCGDMNVAVHDADVHDAPACRGHAGFTDAERDSFRRTLRDARLADAYRALHPHATGAYTFWDYRTRARKAGWRIDYFCVSECMVAAPARAGGGADSGGDGDGDDEERGSGARARYRVTDVWMEPEVYGSDHCPVGCRLALARRTEASDAPTR